MVDKLRLLPVVDGNVHRHRVKASDVLITLQAVDESGFDDERSMMPQVGI